ncbi:hypothetical protein MN116_002382, partial [Schistosoma mekongi]
DITMNYVQITGEPVDVIVQQPQPVLMQPSGQYTAMREWSSGICSCFDDCESCICGSFCFFCYLCHLYNISNEACWLPLFGYNEHHCSYCSTSVMIYVSPSTTITSNNNDISLGLRVGSESFNL